MSHNLIWSQMHRIALKKNAVRKQGKMKNIRVMVSKNIQTFASEEIVSGSIKMASYWMSFSVQNYERKVRPGRLIYQTVRNFYSVKVSKQGREKDIHCK